MGKGNKFTDNKDIYFTILATKKSIWNETCVSRLFLFLTFMAYIISCPSWYAASSFDKWWNLVLDPAYRWRLIQKLEQQSKIWTTIKWCWRWTNRFHRSGLKYCRAKSMRNQMRASRVRFKQKIFCTYSVFGIGTSSTTIMVLRIVNSGQ